MANAKILTDNKGDYVLDSTGAKNYLNYDPPMHSPDLPNSDLLSDREILILIARRLNLVL